MRNIALFAVALTISTPALAEESLVEHGDYLANRVANCGDCHSPHGDHNQVIAGKEFTGAPFRGLPAHPMPNFAYYVPPIRGLPNGYSQADMIRLLETGEKPNGTHPNPPMPHFRFNEEDARAVTAYLASFKP